MSAFAPARLNGVPLRSTNTVGYRSQTPGFDARSGEGARRFGGRYNPPRSFPVVYLCLSRACVVAELTRQALRQSVQLQDLLPRELWALEAALERVLDLTDAVVLSGVGLTPQDLVRGDHGLTQEIGEAAHERGIQAVKSPSATGVDEVLAVFPENLAGTTLSVDLAEVWSVVDDLAR